MDAVQAAWRVMWINRFRTALTLLGIVIGVASVVVMLAVGEGSKRQVMAQMGAFGSNIIYLSGAAPNPRTPPGIITLDDVARAGAPAAGRSASCRSTARRRRAFRQCRPLSYVGGNDTNFPAIFNWPVVRGQLLHPGRRTTTPPPWR